MTKIDNTASQAQKWQKKCGNIQATNMYTNKWFKIIKIIGKFNAEGSTKW